MNITVSNLQRKIPIPVSKIQSAARKALHKLSPSLTLPIPSCRGLPTVAGGREYPLELSIVFAGLKRMRQMNKKYLKHDYVTDVITFNYTNMSFPNVSPLYRGLPLVVIGNPGMCTRAGPPIKAFGGDRHFFHGEIVVCPQAAARNAKRYGNSIEQELILYVVHGILHLTGYDDKTPEDVRRMREKERELM